MLILPGAPAASAFRLARLQERITAIDARVTRLQASFVHFADCESGFDAAGELLLRRLLGVDATAPAAPTALLLLVVPRPGTISRP